MQLLSNKTDKQQKEAKAEYLQKFMKSITNTSCDITVTSSGIFANYPFCESRTLTQFGQEVSMSTIQHEIDCVYLLAKQRINA